jgi:hypothetical protein
MPEIGPKRATGCESDAAKFHAFACIRRVVLDIAHALDATGDHDIGSARLHHHRRVDHRLQAAAASAI